MRTLKLFIIIFLSSIPVFSQEPPVGEVESGKCLPCHKEVTPQIVKEYTKGAMGKLLRQNRNIPKEIKEPGCADCHGADHTQITNSKGIVSEEVCGSCHTAEYQQHIKGGHSGSAGLTSWDDLIQSPDYFLIPPEVRKSSCEPCHSISGATDRKYLDKTKTFYNDRGMLLKRNGCDSCHLRHEFNTEKARKPEVCMSCHSGGHSSDYESYIKSPHGAIYINDWTSWDFSNSVRAFNYSAPTCVTCHMLKIGDTEIELKHKMTLSGDAEFISLCSKCHETRDVERIYSELNIYKKYLEDLILNNETINEFLKKNKLVNKGITDINLILRVLQNQGIVKNIPCLTDIVSSFNAAVSGISHSSVSIYFSDGINNLNQSLSCFEQWYSSKKVLRKLNLYVKIALLLSVIALFLFALLPRRRVRKTTIEF